MDLHHLHWTEPGVFLNNVKRKSNEKNFWAPNMEQRMHIDLYDAVRVSSLLALKS